MSPFLILSILIIYILLLFYVARVTSRKATQSTFYIGNKQSSWYIVAFGMIGASLSGVTFMSVPGWVGTTQFTYLMIVFGYVLGYAVIATVLLPLYYKLNLTSIYSYLEQRYGFWSYKSGAFFFLLSRTIGASFRMFIVINVLQLFIFDSFQIPFWLTVLVFITLVILYTYQGGIRTIIYTDTLQTTFMLLAVVLSIFFISNDLKIGISELIDNVASSNVSNILNLDWQSKRHFIKQFISGAFITIVMTGLDQEMMQKNLSCKNLRDAQKNMFSFSIVLVFVNLMFLFLGAILLIYSNTKGISQPATTDDLFPTIALQYLGPVAGIVFIIGLISAAFPSADGALTSLTTSFTLDFLELNKRHNISEQKAKRIRYTVHFCFALVLLLVIIIFKSINDQAVINKLFTVAGYTYGPLLGLYSFGLFTKLKPRDKFVPLIALTSPVISYILDKYSVVLFNGYTFGFEILIVNGAITFCGLLLLSLNRKH